MLRRGVIADSSTTSLNLQPSLVMPAAALDRALEIVADSIEAALADDAAMTALETELRAELERDGRGRDAEADPAC